MKNFLKLMKQVICPCFYNIHEKPLLDAATKEKELSIVTTDNETQPIGDCTDTSIIHTEIFT